MLNYQYLRIQWLDLCDCGLFESSYLALSMYQFIEGLVENLRRYCISKIGYNVHYIVYYFLLHLWNAITQDSVIGFMRFWTFLKALVFLYLYSNLQKDWLKTHEDIASQRLDTIYNILEIYIRYIYYVHGQMSWTLQSSCPWTGRSWTSRPWTLSRPITSTASSYL